MTKKLWTDGSASPNPGPGGYAVLNDRGEPVRLGHEADSSNIRMEGAALIAAMEYAGEEECEIYTDSQFWKSVLEQWAESWETRGWTKKTGPIKNLEMVKTIWKLYNEKPVRLRWVQGHAGTELNEMADEWANRARKGAKLDEESEILKGILR